MKWKSHSAIARAIAREMGLPKPLESALVLGSIEPDRLQRNFSHHRANHRTIMDEVWKARKAFLSGELSLALRHAGRAIHYVQDRCISKGPFGLLHERRERRVSELDVDLAAVRKGLKEAVCSPHFVERVVKSIRSRGSAEEAMGQACLTSAMILGAILCRGRPPEGLTKEYERVKMRHRRLVLPLSLFFTLLAFMLGLALKAWLLLALSPLFLPTLPRLDVKYYRLKEEVLWYLGKFDV